LTRIVDTKALATALFKDIKPSGDTLSWQMKLMNFREKGLKTSQGFLLKHFGIDHDPSKLHNAMYDITMNYKIFRKLIMGVDI
jgi:DNA polymerase III epsilon subunit-like protein